MPASRQTDRPLAAQRDQLSAAGANRVYQEKQSGAKSDSKELAKLLKKLEANDLLLVTKLDRLARSTKDLLIILDDISNRGIKFKSLRETSADTTTPYGKLVTTILGGVAEFECQRILERTDEGRIRAKDNGIGFGRKLKLTPHQRAQALELRAEGKSQKAIGRLLNVSHQTIGRLER